jgi:hypothetical protein
MLRRHNRTLWIALAVVFAVACALRLAYLAARWPLLPDWNVDALGYHQLAANLIEGRGFSLNTQAPFQPDAIRTPAYPAFIAAIYLMAGVAPRAVLVAQAMLDSVTALLVAGLALNLTRNNRAAVVAGALYALYPTAWNYCAELYSECALGFVLMLTLWLLSGVLTATGRRRMLGAIALGAACGLSLLVKPGALLLPAILLAALLWRRRWREAAVCAAVVAMMLTPWVARNALVFGRPMLSTVFENNLARVSAPATLAQARGEDVAPWTPRWEQLYEEVVSLAAHADPALFAIPLSAMTPAQLDQAQVELAAAARQVVAANPVAFALSHLKGSLRGLLPLEQRTWFAALTGRTWESVMPGGYLNQAAAGDGGSTLGVALACLALALALYAFVYTAAVAGAWRLARCEPVLTLAIGVLIVYLLLMAGPISYERFRLPAMAPLITLIAGLFLPRYRQVN